MPAAPQRLFLPGFGASGSLYRPGLPAGWETLDPPDFRSAEGSLDTVIRWVTREIGRRRGPVVLGGHSMGGALAIAAAAALPGRVQRLVLLSPAGLPLRKPIGRSLSEFVGQLASRRMPAREGARAAFAALRAPAAGLRLARAVHDADLSREMRLVHGMAVESVVVGCTTDSLVTVDHCRRTAALLGGRYDELAIEDGHMWMLARWELMAELLTAASA